MQNSPRSLRRFWAGLTLVLVGCGSDDPFGRVATQGTVKLDGQPVPYAQILVEGQPDDKNRSAKSTILVVNGEFEVGSSVGPAAGENSVSIALYTAPPKRAETPDEEDVEGDLVGTWTGTVNVESGQPLELSLTTRDLRR